MDKNSRCDSGKNGCVKKNKEMFTVESLIADYKANYSGCVKRELKKFQDMTLRECIDNASGIIKKHSHQYNIRNDAINAAYKKLSSSLELIEECRYKDFDDLISLIADLIGGIDGIGDLYVYDISLRIGANLGKYPKKVYLHRGSLEGARIILGNEKVIIKGKILEKSDFYGFGSLEPYEIEDVLCIYKDRIYFLVGNAGILSPIRIIINSNDHYPPHFHAETSDGKQERFTIDGCRSLDNKGIIGGRDLRELKEWHGKPENNKKLKESWNKGRTKYWQVH